MCGAGSGLGPLTHATATKSDTARSLQLHRGASHCAECRKSCVPRPPNRSRARSSHQVCPVLRASLLCSLRTPGSSLMPVDPGKYTTETTHWAMLATSPSALTWTCRSQCPSPGEDLQAHAKLEECDQGVCEGIHDSQCHSCPAGTCLVWQTVSLLGHRTRAHPRKQDEHNLGTTQTSRGPTSLHEDHS